MYDLKEREFVRRLQYNISMPEEDFLYDFFYMVLYLTDKKQRSAETIQSCPSVCLKFYVSCMHIKLISNFCFHAQRPRKLIITFFRNAAHFIL